MDGNEADRFGRIHAAETFDDARARQSRGAPRQRFGQDEFVVLGATGLAAIDHELYARLAIDGCDATFASAHAIDAQHAVCARAQPLDDARFIAVFGFRQPRKDAFAAARQAGCIRLASGDHVDRGWFVVAFPTVGPREYLSVGVLSRDFENCDFRKLSGPGIGALARARDRAVLFQFFQDALQRDAVIAFDTERARNVALRSVRFFRQRFENALFVERFGRVVRPFPCQGLTRLPRRGSSPALSRLSWQASFWP